MSCTLNFPTVKIPCPECNKICDVMLYVETETENGNTTIEVAGLTQRCECGHPWRTEDLDETIY